MDQSINVNYNIRDTILQSNEKKLKKKLFRVAEFAWKLGYKKKIN